MLTAAVHIAWPTTVSIDVVERIPVAAIATEPGGPYAICDDSGRLLEVLASRPPSFPLVALRSGSPGGVVPGDFLPASDRAELQAAAAMPESLVPEVLDIAVGSAGVVVNLTDHLVAILGSSAQLGPKYVALATVLAHGGLSAVAAIDLRVATAPVLVPKGRS